MPKETLYNKAPKEPGVYIMKGEGNKVLYIGKAGNLRRRVSSYFLRAHDRRIELLVSQIKKIDYQITETAVEALILEAKLIKEYQPPFNIREKDDSSFWYVHITADKWPQVQLVRGREKEKMKKSGSWYGPFTNASDLKSAMRIIRKIFPYSTHPSKIAGTLRRQCFNAQIGLCPGVCIGGITRSDYINTIRNLKLFLGGKKEALIKSLEKEMKLYLLELYPGYVSESISAF